MKLFIALTLLLVAGCASAPEPVSIFGPDVRGFRLRCASDTDCAMKSAKACGGEYVRRIVNFTACDGDCSTAMTITVECIP